MEFILIIGLIIVNGLLSMAEIAFVSARKARLELLAKKGSRSARKALDVYKHSDRFLSTIQIGITLTGILTGLFSGEAFAGALADALSQLGFIGAAYSYGIAKLIIVVAVTYLTLVLGELVPKHIGLGHAEQVAMLFARPMDWLAKLTAPFVWLLSKSTKVVVGLLGLRNAGSRNKVTEEEIKAIVHEGFEGGAVQEVEQDIVERVFHLGDRSVGSIMTHRNDLVWIDSSDSREVVHTKVKAHLYNTYPVASDKVDNIKGVVFLKELFGYVDSPDFSISTILRPAHFIQEHTSVYKALEQFRIARIKYCLVTDEFGGIQGIVTLKDMMDALIGEVREDGEQPEIVKRADNSLLVDGQCSFYSFLEYFDREDLYEDNGYNTLSGLILDKLERVPAAGDRFSWLDFRFEIARMDGARIDKVVVRKN